MLVKIFFVLATLVCYECLPLYSSFWAPLFNPRILNYKVEIPFNPNAGKNAREEYNKNYGYRGEKLIADFGNRRGPLKDKVNMLYILAIY